MVDGFLYDRILDRVMDPYNVVNAAELVYYRLRLGDVAGGAQAWRGGCAALLLYATRSSRRKRRQRTWLRERTRVATAEANVLVAWENEAQDRIRAVIARGVVQLVGTLLAERAERSPVSPLVLYDAWLRWALSDDVAGSREILLAAGDAERGVGRDRAVLAAWLAPEAGDRPEADRQLLEVAAAERWADRPEPELEALTSKRRGSGLRSIERPSSSWQSCSPSGAWIRCHYATRRSRRPT